jgi:hypothetical protein
LCIQLTTLDSTKAKNIDQVGKRVINSYPGGVRD